MAWSLGSRTITCCLERGHVRPSSMRQSEHRSQAAGYQISASDGSPEKPETLWPARTRRAPAALARHPLPGGGPNRDGPARQLRAALHQAGARRRAPPAAPAGGVRRSLLMLCSACFVNGTVGLACSLLHCGLDTRGCTTASGLMPHKSCAAPLCQAMEHCLNSSRSAQQLPREHQGTRLCVYLAVPPCPSKGAR